MHLFNQLVREKYPNCKIDETSSRDYKMADQLMVVVGLFMNSAEVLQGDVVLEVDDYDDDDGEYMLESDDDEKSLTVRDHSYSYKTMLEIVEFANTHQLSTVQHRYRLIKQQNQLKRIRKYVKRLGTKRQKLDKLDQFVFSKFNKIRNKSLPIHNQDLRRMAIGEAK